MEKELQIKTNGQKNSYLRVGYLLFFQVFYFRSLGLFIISSKFVLFVIQLFILFFIFRHLKIFLAKTWILTYWISVSFLKWSLASRTYFSSSSALFCSLSTSLILTEVSFFLVAAWVPFFFSKKINYMFPALFLALFSYIRFFFCHKIR